MTIATQLTLLAGTVTLAAPAALADTMTVIEDVPAGILELISRDQTFLAEHREG